MLGNKMDFSSCVIWTSFHKSSHKLCWHNWLVPIAIFLYCMLKIGLFDKFLSSQYIMIRVIVPWEKIVIYIEVIITVLLLIFSMNKST